MQRNLREEVLKFILNMSQSEATKTDVKDDDYDTELTKMASSSSEKGVNEIQSGDKNLDKEFKKEPRKVANIHTSKKSKKSRKKNKKNKRH